jgi:hypothetical protein
MNVQREADKLLQQAIASESADELRRLSKALDALGATDYASFARTKAHRLEQELAESLNA